jgi:hypothetical protein
MCLCKALSHALSLSHSVLSYLVPVYAPVSQSFVFLSALDLVLTGGREKEGAYIKYLLCTRHSARHFTHVLTYFKPYSNICEQGKHGSEFKPLNKPKVASSLVGDSSLLCTAGGRK